MLKNNTKKFFLKLAYATVFSFLIVFLLNLPYSIWFLFAVLNDYGLMVSDKPVYFLGSLIWTTLIFLFGLFYKNIKEFIHDVIPLKKTKSKKDPVFYILIALNLVIMALLWPLVVTGIIPLLFFIPIFFIISSRNTLNKSQRLKFKAFFVLLLIYTIILVILIIVPFHGWILEKYTNGFIPGYDILTYIIIFFSISSVFVILMQKFLLNSKYTMQQFIDSLKRSSIYAMLIIVVTLILLFLPFSHVLHKPKYGYILAQRYMLVGHIIPYIVYSLTFLFLLWLFTVSFNKILKFIHRERKNSFILGFFTFILGMLLWVAIYLAGGIIVSFTTHSFTCYQVNRIIDKNQHKYVSVWPFVKAEYYPIWFFDRILFFRNKTYNDIIKEQDDILSYTTLMLDLDSWQEWVIQNYCGRSIDELPKQFSFY